MTLDELQQLIDRMYSTKDQKRGVEGTFMWLMEEVGELAAALRESSREDIAKEFADVLAWLATIANVAGINLTEAVQQKYGHGCPGCGKMVCICAVSEKP
jgi:NTP pyrophosphatase (non-canonical NTP hydrolase)